MTWKSVIDGKKSYLIGEGPKMKNELNGIYLFYSWNKQCVGMEKTCLKT